MAERIFHLTDPRTWPRDGRPHEPTSLHVEGFLHASFPHQLADTLARHFDPEREETPPSLLLLELDAAALAPDLRVEVSRDAEDFPHLYRALARQEVLRWWSLTKGSGWKLPLLASTSAGDVPQGTAGAP